MYRSFYNVLARAAVAVAFALLFCFTFARYAPADEPAKITGTADAIFLLDLGDGECTGFAVTQPNLKGNYGIVTAGHCAEDAFGKIATAKDSLGRSFPVIPIYYDAVHDIAVFAGIGETSAAPAKLACHVPVHVGDAVTITGFPLDFGRITTFGKISAMPSPWAFWPSVYRVNIFAGPGNSGSPVMAQDGSVIGILVGGDPHWPGMSMVVPIDLLCSPEIV